MVRTGVLFVGALGHIATTIVLGVLGLRRQLMPPTGMVTATEAFSRLDLVDPIQLVFGGWDVRSLDALDNVVRLNQEGKLLDLKRSEIEAGFKELFTHLFAGTVINCGASIENLAPAHAGTSRQCPASLIAKLRRDIRKFRRDNGLERVVVVNLASTEPPVDMVDWHHDLTAFEKSLSVSSCASIRASTLYAFAAIEEGCPYINFTPSNAATLPAIIQLAERNGVPIMGNDGKTGETLVKSALAPMFKCRNLNVLSWEGFNILGNLDGQILSDPDNKRSKIRSKDMVLPKVLGYSPHSAVHINYVPSLLDQKIAWDFIHFQGFLNVKMSLQLTWEGYDSILAAPLVLDLIRLAELADRRNERGLMPHAACFFKAPIGVDNQNLFEQFQILLDYVEDARVEEMRYLGKHN